MVPRDRNGQLVFGPYKLRETSAGYSLTIPVDAVRSHGWRPGDSMLVVWIDDGLVVCKLDDENDNTQRKAKSRKQ